ncbi:hypothetical protein J6590_060257 [Homalodisca vitripennis]|nr:hypothetical protein J6590_060257 [Homalodisca vitripennis]
MSEIWITEAEVKFYQIPGFSCFACCNETYRAGGSLVYVNTNIIPAARVVCRLETADCTVIEFNVNKTPFSLAGLLLNIPNSKPPPPPTPAVPRWS